MPDLTLPQLIAGGYGLFLIAAVFAWHYFRTGRFF